MSGPDACDEWSSQAADFEVHYVDEPEWAPSFPTWAQYREEAALVEDCRKFRQWEVEIVRMLMDMERTALRQPVLHGDIQGLLARGHRLCIATQTARAAWEGPSQFQFQ